MWWIFFYPIRELHTARTHTHSHELLKHHLARTCLSDLSGSWSYSLRHVNLQALHQPPICDLYLVSAFQVEFE